MELQFDSSNATCNNYFLGTKKIDHYSGGCYKFLEIKIQNIIFTGNFLALTEFFKIATLLKRFLTLKNDICAIDILNLIFIFTKDFSLSLDLIESFYYIKKW